MIAHRRYGHEFNSGGLGTDLTRWIFITVVGSLSVLLSTDDGRARYPLNHIIEPGSKNIGSA